MHAQQKTVKTQTDTDVLSVTSKSDLVQITKAHLDGMCNALINKKAFSKSSIRILDNYGVLRGYQLNYKDYTFQVTDKSGVNSEVANQILFCKMDVVSNKTHYELNLENSETNNIKYAYFFESLNGKWNLKY